MKHIITGNHTVLCAFYMLLVEDLKLHKWLTLYFCWVALGCRPCRSLHFTLSILGGEWRVLRLGVTCSNLGLKLIHLLPWGICSRGAAGVVAAEPVGGLGGGGRGDGDLGSAGAAGRGKKWSDLGDVRRGDPASFADALNGGWEPNQVTPVCSA